MRPPLIVIAGPTASGKTSVSIELAKRINGEIISADSMQVYRFMDIGTAKPTKEEMDGIKHYLIDELLPDEEFSVAIFQKMAKRYIQHILEKGKFPILVGGTGFYINALVNDNDFMSTNNDFEYRNSLYQLAIEKGNEFIHNLLRETDPESAEKIHFNNMKRVVRALEYYHLTGQKISVHNKIEKQKESIYDTQFFILTSSRERMYQRIDERVDKMVDQGLVEEVKKLMDMGYSEDLVSMQGLGYKEIVPVLKGNMSLDESISILKRDTRHFAKRQITWFKNQCDGVWIDVDEFVNKCIIVDNIVASLGENAITQKLRGVSDE